MNLKSATLISGLFFLWSCNKGNPTARLDLISDNVPSDTVAASSSGSIAFVSFGDWGTGDAAQQAVAQQIITYCGSYHCDFVLTLGDNFYENGVESVNDPQWQTKYRDVYGPLGLDFYVAAGNHDAYGSLQAQIDYSAIDPTWNFPAVSYTFSWPPDSASPVAEFFVVGVSAFTQADKEWLEEAIADSRAEWKFLVRHYPLITNVSSEHEAPLADPLLEAAICNKIDLVLVGHNHLFSVLRGPKGSCWIEQVMLGTGGAPLQEQRKDRDESRLVTTAAVHGFGWFQVSEENIIFRMVSETGYFVFSALWEKANGP